LNIGTDTARVSAIRFFIRRVYYWRAMWINRHLTYVIPSREDFPLTISIPCALATAPCSLSDSPPRCYQLNKLTNV